MSHYPHSINHAKENGYTIIDIRRSDEIDARPLPQADEEIEMSVLLADPAAFLEKDQPVLLVCAAGKRAEIAALQLHIQGYQQVYAYPSSW
ncbi:MAG: rhodanese-like domain-containing protein [Cardiobacteriaceae bacterium]|nr:rhodanese-like domain-containing protein [Cardiobacteriaceae bacterium]